MQIRRPRSTPISVWASIAQRSIRFMTSFAKSPVKTSTKKLVNTFPKRELILIARETPTGVTDLEKKKLNEACDPSEWLLWRKGTWRTGKSIVFCLWTMTPKRSFWNWTPMFRPSILPRGGFLLDWSLASQQRCGPPKRRSTLQPSPPRNQGLQRISRQEAPQPETPPSPRRTHQPPQTFFHRVCSSLAR